jgi:hypothetical protein
MNMVVFVDVKSSKTNQIDGLGNRQLGQVHNFGNSVLYQSPKSDDHKEAIGISGC